MKKFFNRLKAAWIVLTAKHSVYCTFDCADDASDEELAKEAALAAIKNYWLCPEVTDEEKTVRCQAAFDIISGHNFILQEMWKPFVNLGGLPTVIYCCTDEEFKELREQDFD